MNVRTFVKKCMENENDIGRYIVSMSDQEKVKMRANLKMDMTNCDNGSIMLSMVAVFISMITFMKMFKGFVEQDRIVYAMLVVIVFAICYSCFRMWCKSKYAKALSYLDDYSKKE